MTDKRTPDTRRGLVFHGSRTTLAPARALTSHFRRRYHAAYRGRFRFARLIFAFDLALLALALGLLVFDIIWFARPFVFKPSGLSLDLAAAPITAASLVPVEVRVRSIDGRTHENVRLTWRLPPWIEIVRADPPLNKQKSVDLGDIASATDKRSRLYLNVRALPQSDVPFTFLLREGIGLSEISFTGDETRQVVGSALTARPAVTPQAVVRGGTIPIRVANESNLTASAVIVRLVSSDGAPRSTLDGNAEAQIGDLTPYEERLIFLEVDPEAEGRLEFAWEVYDAARSVHLQRLNLDVAPELDVRLPEVLRSAPAGEPTVIPYAAGQPSRLWVFHPLQERAEKRTDRMYDLAQGIGQIYIPLRRDEKTKAATWSVIPVVDQVGRLVLGKRHVGIINRIVPFSVAVRYYADTGDQLGVGPLPPQVGEKTTYWVVWSLGPTETDLQDIALRVSLAPDVFATGKYASRIPGIFSTEGNGVRWEAPSLPATGDVPSTFAFEISFIPKAAAAGEIPELIMQSSVSATEVRSGTRLTAEAPPQNTDLEFDIKGKGKGRIE